MSPEDLVMFIEKAFEGLERPSLKELVTVEDRFIDAVGSKTWQELRPLRRYSRSGMVLAVLSAEEYQYYIPAYLVALIDESAEEFYLNDVLRSLWYESRPPSAKLEDLFDPRKGFEQTLQELQMQMPHLTERERTAAAEVRVGSARKLAYLREKTGWDWRDGSSRLRARWEDRMSLLTDPQKRCIARTLVHILERTTDESIAPRIRTMLDTYWGGYLAGPE